MRKRPGTNWNDIQSRDNQYCTISEYKNKENQFLSIVKIHEINQPSKNSTTKEAAKLVKELDQTNEISGTEKEDVEHTKAKLGAYLKKKWGSKVMLGQYMRSIYR